MIKINLVNIEQVIFSDSNALKLLDDLTLIINKWKFSKVHNMDDVNKKTQIEFLNHLNEDHVLKLKNYFKDDVVIEKLDNNLSYNDIVYIDDSDGYFNNLETEYNLTLYRDRDKLYLTYWR